jgi:cobalt-zinc-cadmium efflux system membrane fusion protein
MKRPIAPLLIIATFLVATFFLAACNRGAPNSPAADHAGQSSQQSNKDEIVLSPAEQANGMIETKPVMLSDEPNTLRVTGRIALADDRTWRVGVRTEGVVMAIYVGLGDYVQKGKVLARYHADEVRDQRAKYRTSLSDLDRLKAAQALAQRNYDRAQTLLSLKAGSIQQTEQARQELLSAQAAVHNAEIEVDRGRDLLEDDLGVVADPAPGNHDATMDEVPIFAPASGYIIDKDVTPGKVVQPSSDTFVIGDLSQVWMLASVRQENLGQLHLGQPVTVTLPGDAGQHFRGKITNLGQQFDPTTRVMQVRIVLSNPANRLRPEMLANAEIPVGERKSVLVIPADAVQQINEQDVVFVKTTPDRFVIRPVRVGAAIGDGQIPVLEGLKAGEQIVFRGSFVLKSHLLRSTMEE